MPTGTDKVWIPEDDRWRVVPPDSGKRCRSGAGFRHRACGAPAVAELNRGRHTMLGRADQWWPYCGEHLYGRRVQDGKVWIRLPADSPAAQRKGEEARDV